MNFDFTGKVALITGASTGIGAGIAELFSKCGASLVLTGRNETNLKEVCKKCKDLSPSKLEPLPVISDVSKEDENVRTVEEAVKRFGRLDILVNNAAMLVYGGVEETSLETYDNMMNVNVRGIFHLTKLCIPHLEKTKGNIVNISGVGGGRALSGKIMTCITKASVEHFTRCTALELASKGIRVNGVSPGLTRTGIFVRSGMKQEDFEKVLENAKRTHPLQRHGEPNDIASAVVFLASEHASFITGVLLPTDGGRHLSNPR